MTANLFVNFLTRQIPFAVKQLLKSVIQRAELPAEVARRRELLTQPQQSRPAHAVRPVQRIELPQHVVRIVLLLSHR